jgi:hypothetical protein
VKAILFGQTGDNVTFGTNSMLIGEESPGGRSNYSMNWNNMQLRITRGNNSSGTIFKLIIEPVNGTSTIISVAQLTLSGPTATGFKVNGTTYTDYFLYAHTLGNLSGIASGESLKISGRYLYIRSSGTTVTARGDSIKGFTILAPNAAVLSVNGTPADFARKGSYITYPGSGGTAVNTWPDAHPAIRPVMVHPNPMQIVDLAALAANHTITVYDFTGKQVKARDIQKMGIYLLRSGTDGHTSKVILIK